MNNTNNLLVLKLWEDLITPQSIELLLSDYYLGYIENEIFDHIDYKNARILYLNTESGEYEYAYFETELKRHLKFDETKEQIDKILIGLQGKTEKNGFIEYLKKKIDYISNKQILLFNEKKFLRSILKDLIIYLKEVHHIDIQYNFKKKDDEEDESEQILKVKNRFKDKDNSFKRLYKIFIKYQIIEEDGNDINYISESDFINAIKGKKTNNPIYLKEVNYIAINAIDSFKDIYVKYNASLVQKSRIYKTKRGTYLTQTNYNKSLAKKNQKNLDYIEIIKKEIKIIFTL